MNHAQAPSPPTWDLDKQGLCASPNFSSLAHKDGKVACQWKSIESEPGLELTFSETLASANMWRNPLCYDYSGIIINPEDATKPEEFHHGYFKFRKKTNRHNRPTWCYIITTINVVVVEWISAWPSGAYSTLPVSSNPAQISISFHLHTTLPSLWARDGGIWGSP